MPDWSRRAVGVWTSLGALALLLAAPFPATGETRDPA